MMSKMVLPGIREHLNRRHSDTSALQKQEQLINSRPKADEDEENGFSLRKMLNSWSCDILGLDNASGGNALVLIGIEMLDFHDLFSSLKLDKKIAHEFLCTLQQSYGRNYYHNCVHGADVALMTHMFLHKFGFCKHLNKLTIFAAILAALAHDYQHDGTSNNFHCRLQTDIAIEYANDSVLEHHHISKTMEVLRRPKCNLLDSLENSSSRRYVTSTMTQMILNTDLSRHADILQQLKALEPISQSNLKSPLLQDNTSLSFNPQEEPRAQHILLLTTALKFADLNHVLKPRRLHRLWSEKIRQELFSIGDQEQALGLSPISPLCDRERDSAIAENQVCFFKFLCLPFYKTVATLVADGSGQQEPFRHLQANFLDWHLESRLNYKQENVDASKHDNLQLDNERIPPTLTKPSIIEYDEAMRSVRRSLDL